MPGQRALPRPRKLPALAWIHDRLAARPLRWVALVLGAIVLVRLVFNVHVLDYPLGSVPGFSCIDPAGNHADDDFGYIVLHLKNITQFPVIALRPNMFSRPGLNQLSGDTNPFA